MALAVFGCAYAAHADYFLWFKVDQSDSASPFAFDTAMVSYRPSGAEAYSGYLLAPEKFGDAYLSGAWEAVGDGRINTDSDQKGLFLTADGVNYDNYQFRVELWDADNKMTAYSDAATFSSLRSSGALGTLAGLDQHATWTVGAFHDAVPEPTSGMLFLLGLASLALRRKRV